jgi:hypothetical protein
MVGPLYRWPRYFFRYAALPNFSLREPFLRFGELRARELRREAVERRLRFRPPPVALPP